MELCHAITINQDLTLAHAITTRDALCDDEILFGPKKFCEGVFLFTALRGKDVDLKKRFRISNQHSFSLTFTIVDDLLEKPLLEGSSQARALAQFSEIIRNIFSALFALGFTSHYVAPVPNSNLIEIRFSINESQDSHTFLGQATCLATLLDLLFFERGLKIFSSELEISSILKPYEEEFFLLLKDVFAKALAKNK